MKKISVIIISLILILQGCSYEQPFRVTGSFESVFLDVGKADAMVLFTENHTVILDTGKSGDGKKIAHLLESRNVNQVDYMILTHFDYDHIGGCADIIKSVNVKNILTPDRTSTTHNYEKYVKSCTDIDITPEIVTSEKEIRLDDVIFKIIPSKIDYVDDNNDSLIVEAYHGSQKFLYAADIEDDRIDEMLSGGISTFNLIKLPHHGAYSIKLADLINATKPEYAILTTTEDWHESNKTLTMLKNAGVEGYSTENGDISAVSNGTGILVKQ